MLEGIIKNITKSDRNFAQIFVSHHVLPDINFNGHCLINNDTSIFTDRRLGKNVIFLELI